MNLHQQFKHYGGLSLKYRNKCIGMLPEIYNTGIYRRYGFHTIYEYGSKLAGLSHDTIRKVLNLHEQLKDAPVLRAELEQGQIGWSKIKTVASIVKPDNEQILVEKIKTMPKSALEVLVREVKKSDPGVSPTWKEAAKPDFLVKFDMKLHRKTEAKLRILKKRLEKESGQILSWNETISKICDLLEPEVKAPRKTKPAKKSRYIPVVAKRTVAKTCCYPGCFKPADVIHHPERYALVRNHENLKPLCKNHHELAHNGCIANEGKDPKYWHAQLTPNLNQIDKKYLSIKKSATSSSYP